MDDKTLLEMLDAVGTRDNPVEFYGLAGLAKERIEAQATHIEALEAALRIEIWNGLKRNGMPDDAATAMVKERMAALESKP